MKFFLFTFTLFLIHMQAGKIFSKSSDQDVKKIFKESNVKNAWQNNSIELKQDELNSLNDNKKMNIIVNDMNSSEINEITKNFFENKTEHESDKLSFFFDFSSFNLSEMESTQKKLIFAIVLSILTILGCCGLLQIMVWLTKDCRINLNEINAREKKLRFLNGKKEEKIFR